jgi:hypothetical protein
MLGANREKSLNAGAKPRNRKTTGVMEPRDPAPAESPLPALTVAFGIAGWLCAGAIAVRSRSKLMRRRRHELALADLRATLGKLATAAQAGTVGDAAAAEYAFAIIARRAHYCAMLVDDLIDLETADARNRF